MKNKKTFIIILVITMIILLYALKITSNTVDPVETNATNFKEQALSLGLPDHEFIDVYKMITEPIPAEKYARTNPSSVEHFAEKEGGWGNGEKQYGWAQRTWYKNPKDGDNYTNKKTYGDLIWWLWYCVLLGAPL